MYEKEQKMETEKEMNTLFRDLFRQALTIFAVLLQISTSLIPQLNVGRVSAQNHTLIVPAGYAFAIWGPIFLLSLGYATYQALPSKRESPLLRAIGGWLAGAYLGNGIWTLLFTQHLFLLAQLVIIAIFACAAIAFIQLVRHTRNQKLSAIEQWLVALPLSLLFGWISAASLVGFAVTGVALHLLHGGLTEVVIGSAILLVCGGIASSFVIFGRTGPTIAYLAYAFAVVWAFIAVIVNQYQSSWIIAGVAILSALAVIVQTCANLFSDWRERRRFSSRLSA